eukprot:TRINITY_DN1997_c0_g2_i4.p1 TRINITY_DN1997_c0_g2~~TRINITY_DN1997_c0_g2_i4.p1  ORF type:complete len:2595 (+),score=492.15 TRINITY_DN1997_c0_g2_i4:39-7823(+)
MEDVTNFDSPREMSVVAHDDDESTVPTEDFGMHEGAPRSAASGQRLKKIAWLLLSILLVAGSVVLAFVIGDKTKSSPTRGLTSQPTPSMYTVGFTGSNIVAEISTPNESITHSVVDSEGLMYVSETHVVRQLKVNEATGTTTLMAVITPSDDSRFETVSSMLSFSEGILVADGLTRKVLYFAAASQAATFVAGDRIPSSATAFRLTAINNQSFALVDEGTGIDFITISDSDGGHILVKQGFIQIPTATVAAIEGSTMYVGSGRTLVIINISNITSPVIVSSVEVEEPVSSIAVGMQTAYVCGADGGLFLYSVVDPQLPILLPSVDDSDDLSELRSVVALQVIDHAAATNSIIVYDRVIISVVFGSVLLSDMHANHTMEITELQGAVECGLESDLLRCAMADGKLKVSHIDFINSDVDPFVATSLPPIDADVDASWLRPLLPKAFETLRSLTYTRTIPSDTVLTEIIGDSQTSLEVNVSGMFDFTEPVQKYYSLYEGENRATINGVVTAMNTAHMTSSLKLLDTPNRFELESFNCHAEVSDTEVRFQLELVAVSYRPQEGYKPDYSVLFDGVAHLDNIQLALGVSKGEIPETAYLPYYYEARAAVTAEIVIEKSSLTVSANVTQRDVEVYLLCENVAINVSGVPLKGGHITVRYGSTDDGMEAVADMHVYCDPFVLVHDRVGLLTSVVPVPFLDVQFSLLDGYSDYMLRAVGYLREFYDTLIASTPAAQRNEPTRVSMEVHEGSNVDFGDIFASFMNLHRSYGILSDGLPASLELDVRRGKAVLMTEKFNTDVLAALGESFDRFSGIGGVDPSTGEVFESHHYPNDVAEKFFDCPAGNYTTSDLAYVALLSDYGITSELETALKELLPSGTVTGKFATSDYISPLYVALEIPSDGRESICGLADFLGSKVSSVGVNYDFQKQMLLVLNETYPNLVSSYNSTTLVNPASNFSFDWRDYRPESASILGGDVDDVFLNKPTMLGYLRYLEGHFERAVQHEGSMSTTFGIRVSEDNEVTMFVDFLTEFTSSYTSPLDFVVPSLDLLFSGTGLGKVLTTSVSELVAAAMTEDSEAASKLSTLVEIGIQMETLHTSPSVFLKVHSASLRGTLSVDSISDSLVLEEVSLPIKNGICTFEAGFETDAIKGTVFIVDEAKGETGISMSALNDIYIPIEDGHLSTTTSLPGMDVVLVAEYIEGVQHASFEAPIYAPAEFTLSQNIATLTLENGNTLDISDQITNFTANGLASLITEFQAAAGSSCPVGIFANDIPALFKSGAVGDSEAAPSTITDLTLDVCQQNSSLGVDITSDVNLLGQYLLSTATYFLLNESEWKGEISSRGSLFGTECEFTAEIVNNNTNWTVPTATMTCDIDQSQYIFRATVTLTEGECGSEASGSVDFIHHGTQFSGSGLIQKQQSDECNDVTWQVAVSASSSTPVFWDLELQHAGIELNGTTKQNETTGENITNWRGKASGAVQLGDGEGLLAANITFIGLTLDIESFYLNGEARFGPISGGFTLAYDYPMGMLVGDAEFSLELGNVNISGITAAVSHVVTYNEQNLNNSLWTVGGGLQSATIWGLRLSEVTINMRMSLSDNETWSGDMSATADIMKTATVSVSAEIADNELSNLKAEFQIAVVGLSLTGGFELTAGEEQTNCSNITATGELSFKQIPGTVFYAGVSYTPCSDDGELYKISLQADDVTFGIPLETSVTGELISYQNTTDGGVYSGYLNSTITLMGVQSSVAIQVLENSLQALEASVQFTTPNGLITCSFTIQYAVCGDDESDSVSTGTGVITIRPKGFGSTRIEVSVAYNSCTSQIVFTGTAEGWSDDKGVVFDSISATVSSGNGLELTDPDRDWIISITATKGKVVTNFEFDNTGASSLAISISSKYVNMTVVKSECNGEGTLTVKNLPHGIPPFTVAVALLWPNGCNESAYRVEGQLTDLVIPLGAGTSIRLDAITVSLDHLSDDVTNVVALSGRFQKKYYCSLNFTVTGTPSEADSEKVDYSLGGISLVGGFDGVLGLQDIASSFSKSVSKSLGSGNPAMYNALSGIKFLDLKLEVDFVNQLTALSCTASFYGMVVKATAVAGPSYFGLVVDAPNLNERSSMPKVVESVINFLDPQGLYFSLSTAEFEYAGYSVRKGMSIRLQLGGSSGYFDQIISSSPSDMGQQVTDARQPNGGLTLMADFVSISEMDVFISLAGNFRLGKDLYFKEFALCFRVGSSELTLGFLITLEFTVGKGKDLQTFEVGGFAGLDVPSQSLAIELSIDSDQPWSRPFGIPGTKVLFPLGIGVSISPLPPFITKFSMIGGMQVGGMTGRITLGADITDFTKSAFKGEVEDINFKRILSDLSGCKSCFEGPGAVLVDSSVKRVANSFNPDPTSPVVIQIAKIQDTIPPGIRLEIEDLKILGVVKITSATFFLDATGVEATLYMEKLQWGPLSITSKTSSKKGPLFDMALTTSSQHLIIDGQTSILGYTTGYYFNIGSNPMVGQVLFKMGSFSVEGEVTTYAKPGSASFKNTLTGRFGTDVKNSVGNSASGDTKKELESSTSSKESRLQSDYNSKKATEDSKVADKKTTNRLQKPRTAVKKEATRRQRKEHEIV